MDYRNVVVLLTAGAIHGSDPALPGIIDTGMGHEQVLRLLDVTASSYINTSTVWSQSP